MPGEASLMQDAPASVPSVAPLDMSSGLSRASDRPGIDRDESKAGRLGGLVLTRHLGESIMVGDEVEVQVVGIKSGTVRLKVVAPRSIPVHRREVFDAIRSGFAPPEPAPRLEGTAPRGGKPAGGLVLARMARESIMIGEDVEIAVVESRPSTVKLRISAPKSVPVHRREVYEALRGGLA
jgi:carbon storage regulator